MTSGEAHSYYVDAKNKYEEAISQKNAASDSYYKQEIAKREAQVRLNDYTADRTRFTKAKEDLAKTQIRDQIDSDMKGVNTEMDSATEFFKTLGESSSGTIDLTKHIMNDNDRSHAKSVVDRIFTNLNTATTKVCNKIEELEAAIKKTQGEIEAAEAEMRRLQGEIDYWEGVKNQKASEMEMYQALERRLAAEEEAERARKAAEEAAARAAAEAAQQE
ncbi:hypothetical protein [uncultured Ruminococcus sp.]|uniref:hypothetical protein n=1 Tax=uncultured Ruminococcus sp. TaxID=165186 RepID=UPI0025FBC4A4|nr:hypothetical protein [uncultured Ruminococcus sp.]